MVRLACRRKLDAGFLSEEDILAAVAALAANGVRGLGALRDYFQVRK